MSPSLGPVRMRVPLRKIRRGTETKRSAWELWKSLPRVKPYLAPYRRTLIAVTLLTAGTALFGLAEPWKLSAPSAASRSAPR